MRYFLIFALVGTFIRTTAQPFRDEIRAFERQDSLHAPARGQVLFIGSSSFRLWRDVGDYFPGIGIINRGFGGSTLNDLIFYEKQILAPYHPRSIVIYCGENDLAVSDTVQAIDVFNRFKRLYSDIRKWYPKAHVFYVSMKPSPSRQRLMPKMAAGNQMIRDFLGRKRRAGFIDVYHDMLDAKGQPRPELFLEDQLHMNKQGYLIWKEKLEKKLREIGN